MSGNRISSLFAVLQFFQTGSSGQDGKSVCAHQVFCTIAMLAQADLQAKIGFILRLYADRESLFFSSAW